MESASAKFECDRCGLCCKLICGIPQLAVFDRGDGTCCHLTDADLCDIYDSRPAVCSVERMYIEFADRMSPDEYCGLMAASCAYLKEHFEELKTRQTNLLRQAKKGEQS